MTKGLAHLGEKKFGLVAETEESFGASELFSGAGDGKHFLGCHRMRAWIGGVAAEGAISAVVAAEIGKREKYLARIGDHAGFEALFGGAGRGQKQRKIVIRAMDECERGFAGDRLAGARSRKHFSARCARRRRDGGKSHG